MVFRLRLSEGQTVECRLGVVGPGRSSGSGRLFAVPGSGRLKLVISRADWRSMGMNCRPIARSWAVQWAVVTAVPLDRRFENMEKERKTWSD